MSQNTSTLPIMPLPIPSVYVGLDIATTAQALGCADGTVKSQLSDARARLRTDLGREL